MREKLTVFYKNNKGFTLAEMLIVIAILIIAAAIAVPGIFTLQKNLRQKSLDAKAEVIYTAVQESMAQLKANGQEYRFAYDTTVNNGVGRHSGIPDDALSENVSNGEICYILSESLGVTGSATDALVSEDTLDGELLQGNWVVEYSPESAMVYAVFYSEAGDRNAATEYVGDYAKYDTTLRYKKLRMKDGARIGYYGGGGGASTSDTVKLNPKIKVTNGETLSATLSCTRPASVTEAPVFEVILSDTEGHSYREYYTYYQAVVSGNTDQTKVISNSMTKAGRTFTVNLTLDDLSAEATRFVNLYGSGSGHGEDEILSPGTALTITLNVTCPENKLVDQSGTTYVVTNSLFADSSNDYAGFAVVTCGRHLQNLDADSGVTDSVTAAIQNGDINFKEQVDNESAWYAVYSSAYYHGTSDEGTVFEPIENEHLTLYTVNQNAEGEPYTITGLNAGATETAGLFGMFKGAGEKELSLTENTALPIPVYKEPENAEYTLLSTGSENEYVIPAGEALPEGAVVSYTSGLYHVSLSGAKIVTGQQGVAGSLVGRLSGTEALVEDCHAYLSAEQEDLSDYAKIWVSGKVSGGLIGTVSQQTTVSVHGCYAATVAGRAEFTKDEKQKGFEKVECREGTTGGLIGSASGTVRIVESYADCYLYGTRAGGLVGEGNQVSLESCYCAGYVLAEKEEGTAAGMVNGTVTSAKNSYCAVSFSIAKKDNAVEEADYAIPECGTIFAIARKGEHNKNVYYMRSGVGESIEELSDTEVISYSRLTGANTDTKAKQLLGDAFSVSDANTNAYNLLSQGLTGYPYPHLAILPYHFGDWSAQFEPGKLVYYELYQDGTFGFLGAGVTDSLQDDKVVIGDGYGLVYNYEIPGQAEAQVIYETKEGKGTETISLKEYTAKDDTYYLYALPAHISDTDYAATAFYQEILVKVTKGMNDHENVSRSYYYNPHFAATVNTSKPKTVAATISVRTARQLNNLSKYYAQYAQAVKSSIFTQGRDIDYTEYLWKDYTKSGTVVSSQLPIGETKEETVPFTATYNGGCYMITGVNIISKDGTSVGFFAKNQGILKNIVLTQDYNKDSDSNLSVARNKDIKSGEEVSLGILAGRNEEGALISNCAVSGYCLSGSSGTIYTYAGSKLFVGGLVGQNDGIIRNSSVSTRGVSLSETFGNVTIGGFAGVNSTEGVIRDSQALGVICVSTARGGNVTISGFSGTNKGRITNSYCATALVASGTTKSYGFAPGGYTTGCQYLNDGIFEFMGELYSYTNHSGVGTPTTYENLCAADCTVISRYHKNTKQENYPFVSNVKDAKGRAIFYGDWVTRAKLGAQGIFYWEYEDKGSNQGFHVYYVGADDEGRMSGNSLCRSHDDGGKVICYGYGYYVQTGQTATLNFDSSVVSSGTVYNGKAGEALHKQMPGFDFYAYTVRTESEVKEIKASNGTVVDDGKSYLYLNTVEPNSCWTVEKNDVTFDYTVCPFFAAAISYDNNSLGESDTTDFDQVKPGLSGNEYKIRSITQLQYLNWNCKNSNTSTIINSTEKTILQQFPYLGFLYNGGALTNRTNQAFVQTHDVDADLKPGEGKYFTSIGTMYDANGGTNTTAAVYMAYFGGSYDGNSYSIKNIEIANGTQSVGLFGVTVGASLKNIILYSENGNMIQRTSDGNGWYNLGGLVGFAAAGNSGNEIRNCSVSGYIIRDNSSRHGYGGANVGGLAGISNTKINGCSAVNDIELNVTYSEKSRNVRTGGLVGGCQNLVTNCYTGGSIRIIAANKVNTRAQIGGIVGGYFCKNTGNLSVVGPLEGAKITNCYTYMDLPSSGVGIMNVENAGPIVANATVEGKTSTRSNNYYYAACREGKTWNGLDTGKETSVTFEQMSCDERMDEGMIPSVSDMTEEQKSTYLVNGKTFKECLGSAFATVSIKEGKYESRIDGKYSLPGNNKKLEGTNYPFPTVLEQNDVITKELVHVHYGIWPTEGLAWMENIVVLDIFSELENGIAGGNLQIVWNGAKSAPTTLKFSFGEQNQESSDILTLGTVSRDGNIYTVPFTLENSGITTLTVSGGGSSSVCTIKVTAELNVTVDVESISFAESGDTQTITMTAMSGENNISELEGCTWKILYDEENYGENFAASSGTEILADGTVIGRLLSGNSAVITGYGGSTTLNIEFDYTYHGHAYHGTSFVDVTTIESDPVVEEPQPQMESNTAEEALQEEQEPEEEIDEIAPDQTETE